MDSLFLSLLSQIEKFIKLISEAEIHLTTKEIEQGGLPEISVKEWRKFVNSKELGFGKLKVVIYEKDINLIKLDRCLIGFRQIARYFSEVACHWSTSYDDIDKAMDNLCQIIFKIDVKYTLGNVKIRKEQNEKNNKNEP